MRGSSPSSSRPKRSVHFEQSQEVDLKALQSEEKEYEKKVANFEPEEPSYAFRMLASAKESIISISEATKWLT